MNAERDPQPAFGAAPLRSFYGFLLACAVQAHNAIWADEVGSEPTSPQFAVLEVLATWPDSDQRRVGELAFLDKSSTMDIVRRLSRDQWITRERNTRDTRRDVLGLTSAAGFALEQLRPAVRRTQEKLLAPLAVSEQERFLNELAIVGRVDLTDDSVATTQLPAVLMRRARQVHTALLADEVGGGITGAQLATIITLSRSPGISQRLLGETAALDKSTAADIVSRLDRKGWLKRSRDPEDGRRQVLELTDEGRSAATDIAPGLARAQMLALEPLGEKLRERFMEDLVIVSRLGDV